MYTISDRMRDVLIEHIDGPVAVSTKQDPLNPRLGTVKALVARDFLRPDRELRPRFTIITEVGRAALCAALADWGDALSRAMGKSHPNRRGRPPAPRSAPRLQATIFPAGAEKGQF